MTQFDEAWLRDFCKRTHQPNPLEADKAAPAPKRPKYGNVKTERDGITFDSKREADRWSELQTLLRAGEIYGVFPQHPFRLPGGIVYIADFVILNKDGTYTVEDVKGVRTPEYKLQRKLMRECLGIEIREV